MLKSWVDPILSHIFCVWIELILGPNKLFNQDFRLSNDNSKIVPNANNSEGGQRK